MCGFYMARAAGIFFAILTIIFVGVIVKEPSGIILFGIFAVFTGVISLCCFERAANDKKNSRCPSCGKDWGLKEMDSEDLGPSSNAYTKEENGKSHTYERHRYLTTYKCSSCGHELQRTEEKERCLS